VIGDLTLSDGSTAASVAYVNSMTDASGAGIPDAPADGVYYARINNSWAQAPITIPSNNVTGDMMVTGNFTVTGFATFGPLTVNGSGKFILSPNTSWLTITSNVATAPPPLLPNDTQLQFVGGDGLCSRTEYVTYGDMGILTFRKANGIGAAPTATNGNMFALIGQGHDGSAWTTSQRSGFYCITQGTWTPTSTPTIFTWHTTTVGAVATAERMRLQSSGNLSIGGTADAGYKLDVTGNARISTGLGVWGATPPATKPSFAGAKGGNTALASVIAILVAAGFGLDTTTA
jgi:hypothetical protein